MYLVALFKEEIMQLKKILENIPSDWLNLTTHRLDIYEEKLAKAQFLDHFEKLINQSDWDSSALGELPTAYDYIRLGHPLSCVLEWKMADLYGVEANRVISFSSQTIPVLAVLRKNLLDGKNTQINYTGTLPNSFDIDLLKKVYGYQFELNRVDHPNDFAEFDGTTVYLSSSTDFKGIELPSFVDFFIQIVPSLGSLLLANSSEGETYISDIQHVRRRETIAMTPADCLIVLRKLVGLSVVEDQQIDRGTNQKKVEENIQKVTETSTTPLMGSSGLSVQYAIMMGLIDEALEKYAGKPIKFIVPPNCYGGTNDQARRVAACNEEVEVVDLPVDGDHDMVQSIDLVLEEIAKQDAIPYIIAEIPTNPRVEVPDLVKLREVLSKNRVTSEGEKAIEPVFILDQTFCPNVQFLGAGKILSSIRTISYASGSKFPSGGKCTAGYCVGNAKTQALLEKIATHLKLCDNEATNLQLAILAEQLPSMPQRIQAAYENTRAFVNFIQTSLPDAKINFVSDVLASQGFTPSVFSLDLPTKGDTPEEREAHKRKLNHQLIHQMITKIPGESKHCVSYGQLKGCYWTIPATSTQGTTKEGDKDYIVRASLSPNMDLAMHKKVFKAFVDGI